MAIAPGGFSATYPAASITLFVIPALPAAAQDQQSYIPAIGNALLPAGAVRR